MMEDLESRMSQLVQRLREKGYRLTPQRMAIIKAILSSHTHPTAEEIYRQVSTEFPMLSLATVYKTLNVLKEIGGIWEIAAGGVSHYDGNPLPHPHLICVKCHRIIDLPIETDIPEEALTRMGFKPLRVHLQIYGICAHCQQ